MFTLCISIVINQVYLCSLLALFVHSVVKLTGEVHAVTIVQTLSGQPSGTTYEAGYVCHSGGQPSARRKAIAFHDSIELPTDWDVSEQLVSVDNEFIALHSSVLLHWE